MAKETITINNRVYKAKEIDFNFLCLLGENGIDVSDIDKKILPVIRLYVAHCMGVSPDVAGNEINLHCINGGQISDIMDVFTEKADDSDFFRALGENKTEQKETPKRNTKKKDTEVSE